MLLLKRDWCDGARAAQLQGRDNIQILFFETGTALSFQSVPFRTILDLTSRGFGVESIFTSSSHIMVEFLLYSIHL